MVVPASAIALALSAGDTACRGEVKKVKFPREVLMQVPRTVSFCADGGLIIVTPSKPLTTT